MFKNKLTRIAVVLALMVASIACARADGKPKKERKDFGDSHFGDHKTKHKPDHKPPTKPGPPTKPDKPSPGKPPSAAPSEPTAKQSRESGHRVPGCESGRIKPVEGTNFYACDWDEK